MSHWAYELFEVFIVIDITRERMVLNKELVMVGLIDSLRNLNPPRLKRRGHMAGDP